ncbi:MAG: hypothetical protein AB7O43_17600 [Hyphomicrobiaceae bacterium]
MLGHVEAAQWRANMLERLERSKDFASAARAFDGSLVLTVDSSSTWFKIYAGRVIDAMPGKGLFGFTFEVSAPAAVWKEAFAGPSVALQKLLAQRKVDVSGNLLEFMRMAKAVDLFVEVLREEYREATQGAAYVR